MDWSNLNRDMLGMIASKVKTLEDFIRLGAVCNSWRSVLKQEGPIFTRPQLPWLMLPCDSQLPWLKLPCHHDDEEEGSLKWQCRRYFSIIENKVRHINFPEPYRKNFVGSSHGWLVMVDSPAIYLLNPLKNKRIDLPPVTTMPGILGFEKNDVGGEYTYKNVYDGTIDRWSVDDLERFFPRKVILSNDPEEEDCIAVALCGRLSRLVFCRIGDTIWTKIKHKLKPPQSDVVHANGKFYVVNCSGTVGMFDLSNPHVRIIHEPPNGVNICDRMYLAFDTTGALLHISRWINWYNSFSEAENDSNDDHNNDNDDDDDPDDEALDRYFYRTEGFNVFRLDEKNQWIKVTDLGENIVFLGDNHSICYSSIEFPECNRNSIYFTDERIDYNRTTHGGHDIGIFSMGEEEDGGSVTRLPCFKDVPLSKIFPRPIWFTPSIGIESKPRTL